MLPLVLALGCVPDARLTSEARAGLEYQGASLAECGAVDVDGLLNDLALTGSFLVLAAASRLELWDVSSEPVLRDAIHSAELGRGEISFAQIVHVAADGDLAAFASASAELDSSAVDLLGRIHFARINLDGSWRPNVLEEISVGCGLALSLRTPGLAGMCGALGNIWMFEASGTSEAGAIERFAERFVDAGHNPARGRALLMTSSDTFATSSEDGSVREWSAGGELRRFARESAAAASSLALASDTWLAAGDVLGNVAFWEYATGDLVATAPAHSAGATHVAFLAGGDVLASASEDEGVLHFWQTTRDEPLQRIGSVEVPAAGVDFLASSGSMLAVGSASRVFLYCLGSAAAGAR